MLIEDLGLLIVAIVVFALNLWLLRRVARDEAQDAAGADLPPWEQVMGVTVLGGLIAPAYIWIARGADRPRARKNAHLRIALYAQAALAVLVAGLVGSLILYPS
ncbi:hypothetical protein [Pontivivens insulae]|uniref:Uncharacterized protein n=1 Tax=Pontivivens insulae TaxID=1639689 RepID=A0A2R8AE88_9RHOB|nr:hypothetical protein [Pontivivens insulae]RED11826.1 hypothetical protein DFR53_2536 [Pontivivens insulae]SPF30583.1 hypothetical protein POI8812_02922 [Pontivivens insulae]